VIDILVHPHFVSGDADEGRNFDLALLRLNRGVARRVAKVALAKSEGVGLGRGV
jgi:hypothetical protein